MMGRKIETRLVSIRKERYAGREEFWVGSLLWRVVDEFDTLLDIALQALHASLDQFLLVVINLSKRVVSLLSTGWLVSC